MSDEPLFSSALVGVIYGARDGRVIRSMQSILHTVKNGSSTVWMICSSASESAQNLRVLASLLSQEESLFYSPKPSSKSSSEGFVMVAIRSKPSRTGHWHTLNGLLKKSP